MQAVHYSCKRIHYENKLESINHGLCLTYTHRDKLQLKYNPTAISWRCKDENTKYESCLLMLGICSNENVNHDECK